MTVCMQGKKLDKAGKYLYGLIGGFLGAFLGFIIIQIGAHYFLNGLLEGEKGLWAIIGAICCFGLPGCAVGYYVYNGDKDSVQDFHHCC